MAYGLKSVEPFKNLYSYENVRKLAQALRRAWPEFPTTRFLQGLERELQPLELKDRKDLLTERLHQVLPANFATKVEIVVAALAQDEQDTVGVRGFLAWPLSSLIAREGLEHFSMSMQALKEITKRFTAEFDIRPFLEQFESECLEMLRVWAQDPNEHVRRLVSEGTRPLLPWGQRLHKFKADPERTLHLLEILKTDDSEYVRKSVANHMNDHSKAHPDWTIKQLERWRREHPDHKGLQWIIRHASRTLLKAGHPKALRLHGYGKAQHIKVQVLRLSPKRLRVGDRLNFTLQLTNRGTKPITALVDYVIHFRKANGRLSPKVFKGTKKVLKPKESWIFEGSHPLRLVTTRTYFSGEQRFAAQINGEQSEALAFFLKT